MEYDLLFKIVISGPSLSGRTSFLTRYTQDIYDTNYIRPLGIDFQIKTVQSKDSSKIIKLQIWDNMGQERFRAIKHTTYRGAHGILLLFDCTDRDWSFKSVPFFFEEIAKHAPENAQIILVATKTDKIHERQVSYDEAKKLADRMHVPYLETSAKENINVQETFEQLVHNIEVNLLQWGQVIPNRLVEAQPPPRLPSDPDPDPPKTRFEYRCTLL